MNVEKIITILIDIIYKRVRISISIDPDKINKRDKK